MAVATSLISLSWSLVSYHRALRMSLPDKINMTWQGLSVQFLWRLHVIAARVLALALFAATFKVFITLLCGIHWIIMFAWIVSMRTTFCENKVEELGYNGVLAVMYIFCYFNPIDTPTRYRYMTFYAFMFVENTVLIFCWFFTVDRDLWYRIPAIIVHYTAFFAGLIFMVIYYLYLHPTGAIVFRRTSAEAAECSAQVAARRANGYKRQLQSGLWTTQGRVLHPRPALSALPASHSEVSVLQASERRAQTPKCTLKASKSHPECSLLGLNFVGDIAEKELQEQSVGNGLHNDQKSTKT